MSPTFVDEIVLFLLCQQCTRFCPTDVISRERLGYLLDVPAGINEDAGDQEEEEDNLNASVLAKVLSSQYIGDPLEALTDDARKRRGLVGRLVQAFCPEDRTTSSNRLSNVQLAGSSTYSYSASSAVTFAEALRRVDERLPFISHTGLERCRQLGKLPLVSVQAVQRALRNEAFGAPSQASHSSSCASSSEDLGSVSEAKSLCPVASGSDAFMRCVFPRAAEDSDFVMGDTLAAVAEAVSSRRVVSQFLVQNFAAYRAEARRHVSSMLPIFLFLAVAFVAVSREDVFRDFAGVQALSPSGPWMNYCKGGPTFDCKFKTRNIYDVETIEMARRFLSVELPTFLWSQAAKQGQPSVPALTGAAAPFGNAFLVGALTIRQKWINREDIVSCGSMNLTVPAEDGVTGVHCGCGGAQFVNVPLNANLSEAISMISDFLSNLSDADTLENSFIVVAQYSAAAMSADLLVHYQMSFTFSVAGEIAVDLQQFHSSGTLQDNVRMCFIAQLCYVIFDVALLWLSWRRGVPIIWSPAWSLLKGATVVLIGAAFVMVENGAGITSFAAADFVEPNVDLVAAQSLRVQTIWGWWLFFAVIACSTEVLSAFRSMQLVVRLVSRAAGALFSMFLVFAVWFFTLVLAAFYLFGRHSLEFSTFSGSLRTMFPFVIASGDSSVFTSERPLLGYAFDVVVTVFFSFLVMNIFVGVLMAPLGSLIVSVPLGDRFYGAVEQHSLHHGASWLSLQLLKTRMTSARVLNVLHDAIILPDVSWSPIYHLLCTQDGESPDQRHRRTVFYCSELYRILDDVTDMHDYPVWLKQCDVRCFKKICLSTGLSSVSVDLMLLACAYESRWSVLRLGRMLSFLDFVDLELLDSQNDNDKKDSSDVGSFDDEEESKVDTAGPTVSSPASRESTAEVLAVEMLSTANLALKESGADSGQGSRGKLGKAAHRASYDMVVLDQLDVLERRTLHFPAFILSRVNPGGASDSPWLSFAFFFMIVVATLWFYIYVGTSLVNEIQTAAMFTQNLHNSLRDGEFRQFCVDATCTSALTNKISFATSSTKDDLADFSSRLLMHALFVNSTAGGNVWDNTTVPGINTTGVAWSSIPRVGRMTVRHLRGKTTPCSSRFTTDASAAGARQEAMNAHKCDSPFVFDDSPIPMPDDSPLGPAAYEFSSTCAEAHSVSSSGFTFPCAGYTAEITTKQQLEYIFQSAATLSGWLGNASTRFIAISFIFYRPHHDIRKIEYNMYAAFYMEGRFGEFWVVSSNPIVYSIQKIFDASFDCFCLAVSGVGLTVCRHLLEWVMKQRRSENGAQASFASISDVNPILTLCAVALVIFFRNSSMMDLEYQLALASIVILVYFAFLAVSLVVLPIASVFSPRATTFSRMFSLIAYRVFPLLPFGVVLWVGFSLSVYIIWGPYVREFSTTANSFLSLSKSFLSSWDFSLVQQHHLGANGILFSLLFFVSVTVVFMPTMLSLVAQCAEDANDRLNITRPITKAAQKAGCRIVMGPLGRILMVLWYTAKTIHSLEQQKADAKGLGSDVGKKTFFMNLWLSRLNRYAKNFFLRLVVSAMGKPVRTADDLYSAVDPPPVAGEEASSRSSDGLRIHFTEFERSLYPTECLEAVVGRTEVLQLREALFLDDLKIGFLFTAIAFVIMEYDTFRLENPSLAARDAKLQKSL
jgi:hypothetical protein